MPLLFVIMRGMTTPTQHQIPSFFGPILWSYDMTKLDAEKDKRLLITQAVNYGDLKHWRWLSDTYGKHEVREVLATLPASEIRPRVQRLASLLFGLTRFNHAPRSSR